VLLSAGRVVADGPAAEVLRPALLARVFDISVPTALALSGGLTRGT
jgi:ABC-type cobalamin/Fe3+-siderophores transport system ATPase subunit